MCCLMTLGNHGNTNNPTRILPGKYKKINTISMLGANNLPQKTDLLISNLQISFPGRLYNSLNNSIVQKTPRWQSRNFFKANIKSIEFQNFLFTSQKKQISIFFKSISNTPSFSVGVGTLIAWKGRTLGKHPNYFFYYY